VIEKQFKTTSRHECVAINLQLTDADTEKPLIISPVLLGENTDFYPPFPAGVITP